MVDHVTSSERRLVSLKDLIGEPIDFEMPNGVIVEVPVPPLKKVLLLTKFAEEMDQAEKNDDTAKQLGAFEQIEKIMIEIIPQLAEHELTLEQIMVCFQEITEHMKPKKSAMLDKLGMTLEPTEKKIVEP